MEKIPLYLQIAGIAIGIIGLMLLIKSNPLVIGLEVTGAALYFAGQFLRNI